MLFYVLRGISGLNQNLILNTLISFSDLPVTFLMKHMHSYASKAVQTTRSIMFNLKMFNYHVHLVSDAKVD